MGLPTASRDERRVLRVRRVLVRRHPSTTVVLRADLRVQVEIKTVRGTRDRAANTVTFANGIKHPNFKDGVLNDVYEGTLIWNTTDDTACADTVSEVYRGDAALHRRAGKDSAVGGIVMVNNPSTNQYAGLVIKSPVSICGADCYNTQVCIGMLIDYT